MRGTAEIAGGGITGLFTGYLLAREGWRVRIHERADDVREIGAGIYLKNNSISLLEHLGIAERVVGKSIWLRRAEIRDHNDAIVQQRSLTGGARVYNLPRSDLVLNMAAVARDAGAQVVTHSSVEAVEPRGRVVLASGETFDADLVIVSDGFRSRLRQQLGTEILARELGNGATRFLVPRTDFEREEITREWWSGRRRVGLAPASATMTYTYMSSPQSDRDSCALPLDVESWLRDFPMLAPFLERLRGVTTGTRFAYCVAKNSRWSNGRVAILGDAAHAMPPTLGQGAGCSMMNAYSLVDTLRDADDVAAGLVQWQDRIRYVTDQTQAWALRYDALMSNWPRWLSGLRRGIIWSFGKSTTLNGKMRVADRVNVVTLRSEGAAS